MHKRLINEAVLELTIEPVGPILVKAGETGADPTRPDMEFVRTWKDGEETVFLPGPSLKGVLRAHCERIARSVQREGQHLSCDPLHDTASCSAVLQNEELTGAETHARSCFICQIFGNTSLAGHLRIADAYPDDPDAVRVEERDGVAIDRVFGSVAVGPFQLEVVTEARFETQIHLKNFALAQLGLLALALRDLKLGRVGVGFGKSRGLGEVTLTYDRMLIRYPMAEIAEVDDRKIVRLLGRDPVAGVSQLAGVGRFLSDGDDYGYPVGDAEVVDLPEGQQMTTGEWSEVELKLDGEEDIEALWRTCVPAWRAAMTA
jgi:CRISPR-associated RAMP protein (TIGR02581 family)